MLNKLKGTVNKIRSAGRGKPQSTEKPLSRWQQMELALEQLEPNTPRDSYLILGLLSDTPSRNEVKLAYRRLIWEYHPDRVEHLPADCREKAYKRATKINGAYVYLKKRSLAN